MKNNILLVSIFVVISLIFPTSIFAQSGDSTSVKTSIRAIEQRVNIAETDLYTNIYNDEILNTLERACDEKAIAKGKKFLDVGGVIMDKKYKSLHDASILSDTWELYQLLESINQDKIPQYAGSEYCKLKYAIVGLQQYLRDKHIEVMERTGIIKDFDGINYTKIEGFDVKLQTLKNHNKKYRAYAAKLGTPIITRSINNDFKNSLTSEQKQLLEETEKLMKNMVSYTLYTLKKANVIDQSDVEIIADKIIFEYVKECGFFNGKYEIKETIDHKGNHIKYETTGLTLKVNLCPSFFVIREMPVLFNKIITHEIGHHVYYYKDDHPDAFEELCWDSVTQRNDSCESKDFVSEYAQVASVEDYAEHFMHRFLKVPYPITEILKKKNAHFDNL